MDANDLFRRLGVGAKFNFKRFRQDAEKLKILRPVDKSVIIKNEGKDEQRGDKRHCKEDVENQSVKKIRTEELVETKESSEEDGEQSESEVSEDEIDSVEDEMSEDSSHEGEKSSSSGSLKDESGSEAEEKEHQLQLLGSIRSKNDKQTHSKANERSAQKKKRKRTTEKVVALKQEQMNHLKRINQLHSHGTDVPDPVSSFEQLQEQYGMSQLLLKNVQEAGFSKPTPIQMLAVPVMLARREILACAPTGSGKTAAFVLPILHHLNEPRNTGFRAVVLAPTRELAKQTYREFVRLGEGKNLRAFYFDKVNYAVLNGFKFTRKHDILITTPNRLVHMLKLDPPIKLDTVEWLVVDESDKLFEEGKMGFRDQLAAIYKACDSKNVRRAMFSATFAKDVERWCKLNLDSVIHVFVGEKNTATELIKQELLFVGSEAGKLLAVRDMVKKGVDPPVLVFVQSKERAEELFKELIYDGINVDVIHSDRTQLQRDNVVNSFRAGRVWILICTELMGRGIDFKGVNLVINYDFPNSAISYIHKIGRTGRAGRPGRAVTFFTEDDATNLKSIANVMRNAGCSVPDYMLKMKKPDRSTKKLLAKSNPKRDSITSRPKFYKMFRSETDKKKKKPKSKWSKSKDEPQVEKTKEGVQESGQKVKVHKVNDDSSHGRRKAKSKPGKQKGVKGKGKQNNSSQNKQRRKTTKPNNQNSKTEMC